MIAVRSTILATAAALTFGAAIASSSNPAQAFEGMHRGGMHHGGMHHRHVYRGHRGGGWGGGAAAAGIGLVGGLMIANAIAAQQQPYGIGTDLDTGETTEVMGIPGGRIVTKRDRRGKVTERRLKHSRTASSASTTDPRTGITISSMGNNDGSRTVTRTDAAGRVLSQDVVR